MTKQTVTLTPQEWSMVQHALHFYAKDLRKSPRTLSATIIAYNSVADKLSDQLMREEK